MGRNQTSRSLIIILCCVLAACQKGPEKTPAIGEAFVGSLTITLRQDLGIKSPVVGTVNHGEKIEILQIRRRFTRIRTAAGIEGWTDQERLLTSEQVEALGVLRTYAATLPSQGAATVNEPLNMHTVPNRLSPSFSVINPGDVVQVLQRKVVERGAYKLPQPEKKASVNPLLLRKKKGKKGEPTPVPAPADLKPPPPPEPPAEWRELSYDYHLEKSGQTIGAPSLTPPQDSWTLVRAPDGRAGWVMFRLLYMQVPDDVALYARGSRITGYFPMGVAKGEDATKQNWLWTTLLDSKAPVEFDSVRVFIYNEDKHRYESVFWERGLQGHFPTSAEPPKFSYIVEETPTRWVRKTYVLQGRQRPKLLGKEPVEVPLNMQLDKIVRDPAKLREVEDLVHGSWWAPIRRLFVRGP